MRLYLDTAPVIYVVEQVLPFFPVVDVRLSASGMVLVASDLTRMECRVKPVREEKADLLKDYDEFLRRSPEYAPTRGFIATSWTELPPP